MVSSIIAYLSTDNPSASRIEQYEFNTWKHRGWSYSVPTNPPVIVIDSRTQRQPDLSNYPPRLLDRYALDWLRREWNKLTIEKENDMKAGIINEFPVYPIFVATTPVMGFAPVEGFVQFLLWMGAVQLCLKTLFLSVILKD